MSVQIQLRRGTSALWTSTNPVLAQGEPGTETDTGKLKVGDGGTAWNALPYLTGVVVSNPVLIQIAASDESTALTTGTKVTFRAPYAFTLSAVRGSLTIAQATGAIFTFNVKESGVTVFSTLPTIDNTEKTTTTAAAPSVVSDTAIADDAEITITIDQIGDGTAKGLKVTLIGTKP